MKHVCICTCSYTIGKHASGSPKFLCFFCTIFLYHIKHIINIYESEEDKRDDDNQSVNVIILILEVMIKQR